MQSCRRAGEWACGCAEMQCRRKVRSLVSSWVAKWVASASDGAARCISVPASPHLTAFDASSERLCREEGVPDHPSVLFSGAATTARSAALSRECTRGSWAVVWLVCSSASSAPSAPWRRAFEGSGTGKREEGRGKRQERRAKSERGEGNLETATSWPMPAVVHIRPISLPPFPPLPNSCCFSSAWHDRPATLGLTLYVTCRIATTDSLFPIPYAYLITGFRVAYRKHSEGSDNTFTAHCPLPTVQRPAPSMHSAAMSRTRRMAGPLSPSQGGQRVGERAGDHCS